MAKKFNASQFKSQIRKIEREQKRAIDNYNRAVRQYNAEVNKRANAYNRSVRAYNSAVRHNKQIIDREIRKLNSQPVIHTSYRVSTNRVEEICHNRKYTTQHAPYCKRALYKSQETDAKENLHSNHVLFPSQHPFGCWGFVILPP